MAAILTGIEVPAHIFRRNLAAAMELYSVGEMLPGFWRLVRIAIGIDLFGCLHLVFNPVYYFRYCNYAQWLPVFHFLDHTTLKPCCFWRSFFGARIKRSKVNFFYKKLSKISILSFPNPSPKIISPKTRIPDFSFAF
jgi:hypothetical protein